LDFIKVLKRKSIKLKIAKKSLFSGGTAKNGEKIFLDFS